LNLWLLVRRNGFRRTVFLYPDICVRMKVLAMKKRLTKIARVLRKNLTPQEAKLWYHLRGKHFENLKFRRQYPISDYIVDFCCPEKKLVIELDGSGHLFKQQIKKDRKRDDFLKSQGFRVYRVENSEIDENLDGVLEEIFHLVSDS